MMRLTVILFLISSSLFGQDTLAKKSTPTKRLLIGVSFSPDYCYRTLKSADDNISWIIRLRNESEVPKLGHTGGINVWYKISDRIGFQAGVLYSSKGYDYKKSKLTFGDEIDPRYGFVYSTQPPYGLEGNVYVKIHYNYNYLDIPFKILFYCGEKRIRFIAATGVTTNIFLNAAHTSILSDDHGHRHKETTKDTYKYNSVNLSPIASVGIDFRLNKRINVSVGPFIAYGILSIDHETYLWNAGFNVSCYYALK